MNNGRMISIDFDMSRQQLMLAIAGELNAAYDLKNKRVGELEKRFDRIDRQVMQAQRRESLCRMRQKIR